VERLLVTKAEAAELAGQLPTMPGLRRYLRISSAGLLRVDRAAIAVEAKLDGKFLLRCSDPQLSAEDIALGYQQLLQVARGWRDLTTHLELRPRSATASKAHPRPRAALLLALLLVRFIETRVGRTWAAVREDLTGPAGTFIPDQRTHHRHPRGAGRLEITPPKKVLRLDPATSWGSKRPAPFRCLPAGNSPRSQVPGPRFQVSLPSDQNGKKCGAAAHVIWCGG
jgi:hypothetical protein